MAKNQDSNNSDKHIYSVRKFNKDNLLDSFNYGSYAKKQIEKSYLFYYLYNFLLYKTKYGEGHRAETIVIEERYLSASYLRDFKYYYAESFNSYSKFTRRIHFFSKEIKGESHFEKLILDKDLNVEDKEIFESYLGYVVVKPITNSFIGDTFLEPYSSLNGLRNYNSIRTNTVNLFGIELEIKGCFFQQQDRVVSACATSALYSALYMTSRLFGNLVYSPSEITKSAGASSSGNRIFPNSGLQNRQMSKAIKKAGLVAEIRYSTNGSKILQNIGLKRIVYAYNKMKLPILLGYSYYNKPNTVELEEKSDDASKENIKPQNHLVTVVGFKAEKKLKMENEETLVFKADAITKFYAHNDQIGPYVKMKTLGDNSNEIIAFEIDDYKSVGRTNSLIIPLIDSIRIKYEDIYTSIKEINFIVGPTLRYLKSNGKISYERIEWDLHLMTSNEYKKKVLDDKSISDIIRKKVALTSYPRYVWFSRCSYVEKDKEIKVFDIIYDPTDTPTGFCCFQANFYDTKCSNEIITSLDDFFEKMDKLEPKYRFETVNENHKKFFNRAILNDEKAFLKELRKFKN